MFQLLEITERAESVSLHDGRILLVDAQKQKKDFALVDLDAVILADPHLSLSGCVLTALAESDIPLLLCSSNYQPCGIFHSLACGKNRHRKMLQMQMNSPQPLLKRIWQSVVRRKIEQQSAVLRDYSNENPLIDLHKKVRSGDVSNVEAHAAAEYWRTLALFPSRCRTASNLNINFNYLYNVLYAATARYLCVLSLSPDIGIHHHNQYNPFCLASDLMEPYRPFADRIILNHLPDLPHDSERISLQSRNLLLHEIYSVQVIIHNKQFSIFSAIRETVLSFQKALMNRDGSALALPEVPACGL